MPVLAHHDTITGPLTAADLEAARRDNPGSIWHPHRHLMPHGCDGQGRHPTRQWGQFPDTVPTGWGDDKPMPTPRVVPCSTVARWWLAVKRWLS